MLTERHGCKRLTWYHNQSSVYTEHHLEKVAHIIFSLQTPYTNQVKIEINMWLTYPDTFNYVRIVSLPICFLIYF